MAGAALALALLLSGPPPQPTDVGPAVGSRIPELSGVDQDGKAWTFDTLRGPKGLLLVFNRSADW